MVEGGKEQEMESGRKWWNYSRGLLTSKDDVSMSDGVLCGVDIRTSVFHRRHLEEVV